MHLSFILTVITSLKCVFSATMVCSETAQGMAVERRFPWGVWQIFSQKDLKVGNILEKFLGLESDPEFCRLRNWTLSTWEQLLLSGASPYQTRSWKCWTESKCINFSSVSTTITAQIMMLRPSDPVLPFSVDSPVSQWRQWLLGEYESRTKDINR